MARLAICKEIRNKDIFFLTQIFAFGSIVLHADPAGHFGQVGSFTPGQEVRFGSLEFTTDPRGVLVLTRLLAPFEESKTPDVLTSEAVDPATGVTLNLGPALEPDVVDTPGFDLPKHI
ncbi:hypothetical protein D1007_40759 [Hordeum vulgare]|nr:hypothetical protein D1007_40759 [Hordeum vulgare]